MIHFSGVKTGDDFLYKKSGILVHAKDHNGVRKLARLFTACGPNEFLNFKVTMFESRDLKHVGGWWWSMVGHN